MARPQRENSPVTANSGGRALALATAIAGRLAQPPDTTAGERGWQAQSLAHGAAGIALLPIERARTSSGGWQHAHRWLTSATGAPISATDDAGLFAGAPAVAFALHAAGPGRYTGALNQLDTRVAALTHRRADQAHARIDRRDLPTLAEFDLIYGLTGIGAYLLHHAPDGNALERVLRYLVRLTEPLRTGGETLPGWWTGHDPSFRYSPGFAGGHANLGLAHGITGPLALLALTAIKGITVDGQQEAISRICTWLDTWRQDDCTRSWWPQWVTREELRTGRTAQPGPGRPSWCYGTPGLARAQQLAALATGDPARQDMAEHALASCLSDPAQLAKITDTSLCHGWAGLFQTVWRTNRDARAPTLTGLPHLVSQLTQHAYTSPPNGAGLLEGDAGLALALLTAASGTPPASRWDACLLLC
jgi:hypothetical protein